MATPKKFGSFAGVFTPSILTILGVIMYMRFGWVVGNAGLWGTLIIVFIAHIISFTTGLSISSIATDKKIGAGGVYYVLSRSLGLPIGGAIGLTLFVGTAFSIALYLIGFSESFNSYLGLDISLNGYRITAGIALLILTIMAFISTSIALKTQFFILVAIMLSLVSIFFGHSDFVPATVSSFGGADSVPMETVFAIFFPAVTGFTAGIAMSGDLKDPKKAIPFGTMSAIIVGLLVYVGLAVFIALMIDPEILKKDNNILLKIAWASPLVVAGIWGATLSSAIGGILGAPRILQAMSLDRITPKIFGKGQGKNNEPRLALILTVIIAFAGILIGELNLIARLVSMFYLAAYGFINLSFFLESWASSDFKPTFKVNKWIGFVGFVTTFIIMFKLDMFAMFMSFVVIGGVYLWLSKKQISLGEGDIWQSVWTNIVKRGLHTLDEKEDHKRNWKPNILLFSGRQNTRRYLLEFSRFLAGNMGLITNFDLIENKEAKELFTNTGVSYKDDILEEFGIFGKRIEVKNIYDGIGMISSVFGFSGIEPNTVLMGWARNSSNPASFSRMTSKLIDMDYNVLYLDYDKDMGFGEFNTIDLWWRGISSNAELSLMLVKLLKASQEWGSAKIRIILVNNTGSDHRLIKKRIEKLSESFRVKAEVYIINNYTNSKSIYELMKIHSGKTDLIIVGIPEINRKNEEKFVEQVNNLVDVLGTTLLVKASSKFEVTDLGVSTPEVVEDAGDSVMYLPKLSKVGLSSIDENIEKLDTELNEISSTTGIFKTNENRAKQYLAQIQTEFDILIKNISSIENKGDATAAMQSFYSKAIDISRTVRENDLESLKEILREEITAYLDKRHKIFDELPKDLVVKLNVEDLEISNTDSDDVKRLKKRLKSNIDTNDTVELKIKFSIIAGYIDELLFEREFSSILMNLLYSQSQFLLELPEKLHQEVLLFCQSIDKSDKIQKDLLLAFTDNVNGILAEMNKLVLDFKNKPYNQMRYNDRNIINKLSGEFENAFASSLFDKKISKNEKKEIRAYSAKINGFSELWYSVLSYTLTQQESDFSLKSLYLGIDNESYKALQGLELDVFSKFRETFSALEKIVGKLEASKSRIDEFKIDENDLSFDSTNVEVGRILNDLHNGLNGDFKAINDEVTLMTPYSFEELSKNQLTDIDTVELSLRKIAMHIFSSDFLHPIEAKLMRLNNQIEDSNQRINSLINLINYFSVAGDKESKTELSLMLDNIKQEYKEAKEKFEYEIVEFKELYAQVVNQLNMILNINHILNNLSELNLNIRKSKKERKLPVFFDKAKDSIKGKFNDVVAFISRKNEDVKRLEYERKLNVFVPIHIKIRKIVSKLRLKKDVKDLLPYYYYQLFTGKHLLKKSGLDSRHREYNEFKLAIGSTNTSIKPVILVTGEAGIGKSYFINSALANTVKDNITTIEIEDFSVKKPLEKALKKLTKKSGNIDFLINTFPIGTTFVLEDIERFICYNEKEKPLLNTLSEIVEKFNHKYSFVFSANINSLKTIDTTSSILSSVLSTITIGPLNEKAIQEMITEMHFADDLQLYNENGELLPEKQIKTLAKDKYYLSDGNPRIAIQLWLAAMVKKEFGIAMNPDFEYPTFEIEDELWLSLLSRMLVFGQVCDRELKTIFNIDTEEMDKNITMMLKSGLIFVDRNKNYKIVKNIKPFVEKWLKEKELI